MKKENRQVIVFILMLTLIFTGFIPQASALDGGSTAPTGASQAEKSLKDIKGHWGEEAIQKALDYGFVQGYDDGTFRPDKAVGRAEFVTMVNKALKLREENTVKLLYSDVKDSDWFSKEIQKASYARYVSGINKTTFMPKKEITRQEAAAMLARILPKDGSTGDTVLNGYKDKDQISPWAKSAVAMAVRKGYLNGYSIEMLGPKGTLSRAEAAKIIGLILEKETIVREDVSVNSADETLSGKIYVGDITIEKSLGEGNAALEGITALSRVYVLGGGTNTIKVSNSTIIQLIVCKEGTKVRVLSDGETSIYNAFAFNGNLLADSGGQSAEAGKGSYFNVIKLNGTISAETAIKIADEIAKRLDSIGQITQDQLKAALAAVAQGFEISADSSGNLEVNLSGSTQTKSGSGSKADPLIINGRPTTLSGITGQCPCGSPFSNPGAFTKIVTFYPSSDAVSTVTAYAIYTKAQLQHLAMHLNGDAILINDLDFGDIAAGSAVPSSPMGALKIASEAGLYTAGHAISNFETGKFVSIGTRINPYKGIFYGNGKTISGLVVKCSGTVRDIGIFGSTSEAAISDLTICGGTVTGSRYVGAIVGAAQGGTIKNCRSSATVRGDYENIGGLVGYTIFGAVIENSNNMGSVSGATNVGGIAGTNRDSSITNSGNIGSVSGVEKRIGGVTGYQMGNAAVIRNCFSTGIVSGGGSVGGIAGCNSHANIISSYSTGAVSGSDSVGSLVGYDISGVISYSYSTGIYSGNNYHTGSVAGMSENGGSVDQCYWLKNTNASGIGESSAGAETAFEDSDPMLSAVYSSIAAIVSDAGISTTGAVSRIDFGTSNMVPLVFDPRQGSYMTTASSLMITISAIPGTSVTVKSGTSLSAISASGTVIQPTAAGGTVYDLSGLSPGTWVLIKAENADPAKTGYYTLFMEPIVEPILIHGNTAAISDVIDRCSCGLPVSSPGAFKKEIILYPDSEATSTVTAAAIYTEAQLQHLALHRNSSAFLMNDLDFTQFAAGSSDPATPMGALKIAAEAGFYSTGHAISDFETGKFVPIGYSTSQYNVGQAYTGSLDGNGKVITGLTVNGPSASFVGLFGYTYQAKITDMTISGGAITGNQHVGAIAGMTYAGSIDSCSNSAAVSGQAYVGGLVGENYNEITISNSHNTGKVSGTWYAGGLIGQNYCAHIKNSYNAGMVSGTSECGGVVGKNYYSDIQNCMNTATVSGSYQSGGISGTNENQSTISNSYNSGAVSGINQTGGVTGVNGYTIGYGDVATILASYNTGAVSGNKDTGGLVGKHIEHGTIMDSYNTGAVLGNTNVGSAIGNYTGGGVDNCYWLEGTNANGIGTGSGITVSSFAHTGPALAVVYSDMEEIAESAGNASGGAVSDIVFGGSDMIPAAFDPLQGSFVFQYDQKFSVYAISDDVTVTVKVGASLSEVLSGGTVIEPTAPGGIEYNLTGLLPGTLVLIKAENALQPEKSRYYTLFNEQIIETVTVNGKPASLSSIAVHCPCGLSSSSPGAFTKEITFYPSSGAVSTVTGFAIYTEAQLQHLAVHLNSNAVLMNDLDFSAMLIPPFRKQQSRVWHSVPSSANAWSKYNTAEYIFQQCYGLQYIFTTNGLW